MVDLDTADHVRFGGRIYAPSRTVGERGDGGGHD
jgi:hypothetical protein